MPTEASLPTDFDTEDSKESQAADSPREQEVAKDVDGIPYCRKHHCRMKRVSGGKKGSPTVYYKCPVAGCDCKAQIINTRRESVVPPTPVACPRCSTEKKSVICERDDKLSTGASVVLVCPSCGWKSNALAVPGLAAQHFAYRRKRAEPAGIGDR